MYKLSVDFKKCQDCEICENLLPGFRSVHGGLLLISESNVRDEEIRAAADRVRAGCPNDAIKFKVIG